MAGCVMNYHNTLAERSSNLDWQIRTAVSLVLDRYADINNVSHHEAIAAYRFLKSQGIILPITENHLWVNKIILGVVIYKPTPCIIFCVICVLF